MTKSGEEEIYSVPQEVLRSISKNFTELQQEFEKAADDSKGDICNVVIDTDADLCTELPRLGRTSFRALTSSLVDRLEVVIHFLAILELFKQGLVDLDQPNTFGDIEVVWAGGEVVGEEALAMVDAYDG